MKVLAISQPENAGAIDEEAVGEGAFATEISDLSVSSARAAQIRWQACSVHERLAVLRRWRRLIARRSAAFVTAVGSAARSPAEVLVSEVIPLCDAIRFLERRAEVALRPIQWGRRNLPLALFPTTLEVRREAMGVVLVIGPANYPLFLPGVQIMQALCAGNAVLVKPAPGCSAPLKLLQLLGEEAGLKPSLLTVVDEDPRHVERLLDGGVQKVVLTGSAETGAAVLASLAPRLIPATMELSGVDAVFIRDDADLDIAARSIAFGLKLNDGATCIAPRRIFVGRRRSGLLCDKLRELLAEAPEQGATAGRRQSEGDPSPGDTGDGVSDCPPQPSVTPPDQRLSPGRWARLREIISSAIDGGARPVSGWPLHNQTLPVILANVTPDMSIAREDLFAPVASILSVEDDEDALRKNAVCPYALAATVFGGMPGAHDLARRVDAGAVVVNDAIVPHADPRLPFAPRGRSGFGATRGIEGLLEMTRIKAISVRAGKFRPHLLPPHPRDAELFAQYLLAAHGSSLTGRVSAAWRAVQLLRRRNT